jgi:hypothetical protein
MKRCARPGIKQVLPLLAGLFALVLLVELRHSKSLRSAQMIRVDGNPDHFHLWATDRVYGFAFTYDPLAADHWLFDSAAVAKNQAPVLLLPARFAPGSNAPPYGFLNRPTWR